MTKKELAHKRVMCVNLYFTKHPKGNTYDIPTITNIVKEACEFCYKEYPQSLIDVKKD